MRKVFLTGLIFLTAVTGLFAEQVIADSKVSEVTVYVDRAYVTREATVSIPAGQTNVIFDNLPPRVDGNSFRVNGTGDALINDIVYETIELNTNTNQQLNALYAQQQQVNYRIEDLNDELNRISSEEQFLRSIISKVTQTSPKEQTPPLNPESWREMMQFYDTNLRELIKERRTAERKRVAERDELSRIQREISKIRSNSSQTKRQAHIILQAKSAQTIKLNLNYLVYGPSWRPEYDLRVDSANKKMELAYYAQIRQNTGEDWNKAKVTLSTAQVQFGGSHPNLSPWYLSIYERQLYEKSKKSERTGLIKEEQMFNMSEADEAPVPSSSGSDREDLRRSEATAVSQGTSVSFVAGGIYDIASDNKDHKIDVTGFSMDLTLRYSIVPKLTQMAFLKAQARNKSDFTILPGKSRVFLDGAFVANSQLDQIEIGQEFWTFLGADTSVSVKYKQINTYDAEKWTKNERTYEYEITVQNNKQEEIDVVIWDQIPLSQDMRIKVKLIEPKYKEDTDELKMNKQGFIEWHYIMKPEEKKVLTLKFEVTGPKDASIGGL